MLPLIRPLSLLLSLLSLLLTAHSLRFTLKPGTRQCFTEDLPTSTKISGEATVGDGIGKMDIDVWVTTMQGTVLFHKRAPAHGKFTFKTPAAVKRQYSGIDSEEEDGEDYDWTDETYRFCIEHQSPQGVVMPEGASRKVSFSLENPDVSSAIEAGERRKEHGAASDAGVEEVSKRMRTMHSTMSLLISELTGMQQKERKNVKSNAKMSRNVTLMSLLAILLCIATSAAQYAYYKAYFKQKKMC